MQDEIRKLLLLHANLPCDVRVLAPDMDLHAAGLTSHATVSLIFALEDRFCIEFPERMLRRRVFATIATIEAAITELTTEKVA